jgi:hypothetical protein
MQRCVASLFLTTLLFAQPSSEATLSGKITVLGTGQDRTHMIYVTDDLKRIVTSNISSATMTIVEKTDELGRNRSPCRTRRRRLLHLPRW